MINIKKTKRQLGVSQNLQESMKTDRQALSTSGNSEQQFSRILFRNVNGYENFRNAYNIIKKQISYVKLKLGSRKNSNT